MSDQAKRFARYYDQCKLPKWATVLGVVLLAFGIVAAGITAIFHDKYSSIFGAWESALTNVWFIAFIALMGVGALISLGYPLLTAIGAGIWVLLSKPEPEVIEEQRRQKQPRPCHRRLAVRPGQLRERIQAGLRLNNTKQPPEELLRNVQGNASSARYNQSTL